MLILLTNDDAIYAPGLAALAARELAQLGEVYVVAPATEQSGVGHSITYLTPLIIKKCLSMAARTPRAANAREVGPCRAVRPTA